MSSVWVVDSQDTPQFSNKLVEVHSLTLGFLIRLWLSMVGVKSTSASSMATYVHDGFGFFAACLCLCAY